MYKIEKTKKKKCTYFGYQTEYNMFFKFKYWCCVREHLLGVLATLETE